MDDLGDGRELLLDYRKKVLAAGYSECSAWPYAYGAFENGFPIPDMGRPAHHEAPELVAGVADPFSEEGYQAFLEIWNYPIEGPDGKPSGVTRLAYRIYRARGDVQAAMPDILNGDLMRFLNWVLSSGTREHHLSDVFVAPIRDAVNVRELEALSANAENKQASSSPVINERIVEALRQRGIWVDGGAPIQVESLNQLIGNGEARLHLSKLAKAIYEARPDLQHAFPDPCGKDGLRFIAWFLTHGVREYRLSEVLLAPLRTQWETVLSSLSGPRRLWHRSVLGVMTHSGRLRAAVDGVQARIRLARAVSASKGVPQKEPVYSAVVLPFTGVNLIGYAASEMGVGESVRCAAKAAIAAELPVAVKSVDAAGPFRLQDRSLEAHADEAFPHSVSVFHVNADQAPIVMGRVGASLNGGRYKIGFWAWELEEFPDRWLGSFQLFDEIWTPSGFCQTAIGRKSLVPVIRMPHAIKLEECAPASRGSLGIPEGAFVFLAIFDLLSVFERKNPLGVIEAFRHAFSGAAGYHLVLKVNHGEKRLAELARIRQAAAGLPVTIIDRTIDRSHVTALIQMSDCLVSLHRSEGFGLTIAEAMYLSKPVIVTAYSGNMDFTAADNSFLVGYELVNVPKGCEPYDEGTVWADPKLSDAVSQMRMVANEPAVRVARAHKGNAQIREQFSPEAVGKMMKDRLSFVARRGLPGTH